MSTLSHPTWLFLKLTTFLMVHRPLSQEVIAQRRELVRQRHAEKLAASQGQESEHQAAGGNSTDQILKSGETSGMGKVWHVRYDMWNESLPTKMSCHFVAFLTVRMCPFPVTFEFLLILTPKWSRRAYRLFIGNLPSPQMYAWLDYFPLPKTQKLHW